MQIVSPPSPPFSSAQALAFVIFSHIYSAIALFYLYFLLYLLNYYSQFPFIATLCLPGFVVGVVMFFEEIHIIVYPYPTHVI